MKRKAERRSDGHPLLGGGKRHPKNNNLYLFFDPQNRSGESELGKPVLIDFYADWCGPCRRQGPIIDELKKKIGEKVDVRKVNVDEHMDEADKYGIQVVPTLIIEKDGKVMHMLEGVTEAAELESMLTPLVE